MTPGRTDQSCNTEKRSSIQLRSAAMAPHYEIAAEAHRVHLAHGSALELKNEPLADVAIRHSVEQQVDLVQRLAGEEDLGDEAVHPAAAENRKVNVRRPPPPARFEHRIRPRLNGEELK